MRDLFLSVLNGAQADNLRSKTDYYIVSLSSFLLNFSQDINFNSFDTTRKKNG